MVLGNLSSFYRRRTATPVDQVDLDHAVGTSRISQQTLNIAASKLNSLGEDSQELIDDLDDLDSDDREQESQQHADSSVANTQAQEEGDSDLNLLAAQRESKENLQVLDSILTKQREIR